MEQINDHRICFVGDSFVQGTCDPGCLGWVGRVCAAAITQGYRITAYNLGIRRDTSDDIARRWRPEVLARLQGQFNAYLVFSFGANDMTFEAGRQRVDLTHSIKNFTHIVREAKLICPVVFVGPAPVGDKEQDERIMDLNQHYQQRASELNIPFLSTAPILADDALWLEDVRSHDGSHPGEYGYQMLASTVGNWADWWF